MDEQKVAQELVKLAKELDAAGGDDAYNWQQAYSYPHLGHTGSSGVVDAIYKAGYDKEQAEAVFKSKTVRHFVDRYGDKIEDFVSKLFSAWLKQHKEQIDETLTW